MFAYGKYEEILSTSRQGINRTKVGMYRIDAIIKPIVYQGQFTYHILCNHPEFKMAVKTMYKYIGSGGFLTHNIDLKRKVKFKKRKDRFKNKCKSPFSVAIRAAFSGQPGPH